ncbi:MAG: cyclopropane fatty acyl phospholipid synthase [Parachlamydiaceae bacterium]
MKKIIDRLFSRAGITVNGLNPWDIQIHDDRFYQRVLQSQNLGLGESYMDGWWDCPAMDEFFCRLLRSDVEKQLKKSPRDMLCLALHRLLNFQTKNKAQEVADRHYNLGNSLYATMLGESMNYSCAYWKGTASLDEAQRNKMELICRKLGLKPGMRLLDIGSGWGALAKYAAQNYGVEVVGTTISQPQKQLAEEHCRGLPVKFMLKDYRDLPCEHFDRIVSVGMFEHVGYKNYSQFMDVASKRLADNGIFLLHTIGGNLSYAHGDPWINKYIFPNGMLPSITQIGKALEGRFVMEDWHNFGVHYDKTLMAWHKNFIDHWADLKDHYGERFKRMWDYYLLSCAGGFRARTIQLWQIVLTKHGLPQGFDVRDL